MEPTFTQPKYDALYRALVTSNVDPTGTGRIKVQCPQIAGIVEIRAAEPANPQEPIPSVGSTVWIGFSGGDITKPFYVTNQAVPAQVTSTTLPANPYPGQLAWETDTKSLEIWDGAAWQSDYSPWISYTPVWTGLTSLGTGFVSNGYYQLMGRTVCAMAMLIGGTGTTLGSSDIEVSLPFTASSAVNINFGWTGAGRLNPAGAGAWHPVWPWVAQAATTASVFALRSSDLAWVTPGSAGLSWTTGAVINVNVTYQI